MPCLDSFPNPRYMWMDFLVMKDSSSRLNDIKVLDKM